MVPEDLRVHLLPRLTTPDELAGRTVVVIDVLRATTTIAYALAAGAKEVLPYEDIDEAKTQAEKLGSDATLGGERGGLPIDGFDLGNSPAEFRPDIVQGKTVVFTTTNGTRAMKQCRQAARVLIGAFVNFSAVCHELAEVPQIDLLCAGTENNITREDVLFAGAVVDELSRASETPRPMNDQAEIAAGAWQQAVSDFSSGRPLAETLRSSRGGRNLIEIGLERDIEVAAQIDRLDVLPELDVASWRIHLP